MSLPWAEVNARDPLEVAGAVGLDDSPSETRKFGCPFCGGSNLHAWASGRTGPHFLCFSGCAGRRYSNVDVASRHWGLPASEACRALGEQLGIACPAPPPFARVNAVPPGRIAQALSLALDEGGGARCPVCGTDGALHPRGTRWRCASSRCPAGGYDHVDLTMRIWALGRFDAAQALADRLGIGLDPGAPARAEAPKPRIVLPRNALQPADVYAEIVSRLALAGPGAAHLAARRFDRRHAEAYGFRTVLPGDWRARILPFLEALGDEELAAAGFPREVRGGAPRIWVPGGGRRPFLLLPYWRAGRLVALRFRDVGLAPRLRYWTLKGVSPPWPFHADALSASTVHVVEGELNAYTLAARRDSLDAVGTPGAGIWDDRWSWALRGAARVVGWYDDDPAGRAGARRQRRSLSRAHGEEWTARHWRRLLLPADPSQLHREDRLAPLLAARPWESAAALHTPEMVEAEAAADRAARRAAAALPPQAVVTGPQSARR